MFSEREKRANALLFHKKLTCYDIICGPSFPFLHRMGEKRRIAVGDIIMQFSLRQPDLIRCHSRKIQFFCRGLQQRKLHRDTKTIAA